MIGSEHFRQNRSFLAGPEQHLIRWILPQVPNRITPHQLTGLGLLGSLGAAIGLIGCNWSLLWLPTVVLGILANWFGNLLDGPLAQHRKDARRRFAFLVDHTSDLFSLITLILAFGLSPFLSLISALMILLCFLLFSAYTYIRVAVHHVRQSTYIGLGATEFRILMIVWAVGGAAIGFHEPLAQDFSRLDFSILLLAAFAVIGLGIKAFKDAGQIAAEEGKPKPAIVPSDDDQLEPRFSTRKFTGAGSQLHDDT